MPHSFGYRARTRDMFKKNFKEHGMPHLSTYFAIYKIGDIVDIKANSAEQKGMPHKFYHGRTGIVTNVTPSAVSVLVHKVVGNRYMAKRVNIRVEHIRHSKCRQEFLQRVAENSRKHSEAKERGETVVTKRLPLGPAEAHTVSTKNNLPQTMRPAAFETTI